MGSGCSRFAKVVPGVADADAETGTISGDQYRMLPEERPVFKTAITEHFTFFLNQPLGRGSFGIVFKAKGKADDVTYAVKCVQKSAMKDEDREDLYREVKIMKMLGKSLNIVYLYDAYEDEQNYYLVMEYCSGGQLFSRVKRFNRRYNEARVANLMRSVLQVCAQCHSRNIIYRDVKPENFLFLNDDADSPVKATDFGLAVHKPPGTPALRLRAGTPAYMAPEVINREYSMEADIWSCGVIAYQLLTGRFPFRGTAIPTYASRKVDPASTLGHMQSMYADIRANEADFSGEAWKTISPLGKDFVKKLLCKDPRKRLTAGEALKHSWMASAEFEESSSIPEEGSSSARGGNLLGDTVVQRLQLFSSYGHIKQALLHDISKRLPDAASEAKTRQLEAAQRLFHEMDVAKSGTLTHADLQRGLEAAGFKLSESEVQQIIKALDFNGTGDIRLEEFEAALVDWRGLVEEVGPEEWQAAAMDHFREIDKGGDGFVCMDAIADELVVRDEKDALERAHNKPPHTSMAASSSGRSHFDEAAKEAFMMADVGHDGKLREEDFLKLVQPVEDLTTFDKRLAGGGRAGPGGTVVVVGSASGERGSSRGSNQGYVGGGTTPDSSAGTPARKGATPTKVGRPREHPSSPAPASARSSPGPR